MEDEFVKNNDFIKHKIKSIDEIDMRNLEAVNKNKQLGLIDIEIEQFNADISLIYNIKGLKPLRDYLLDPLSKEKAYSLIKSINNSMSMQSYILDTGIVSAETTLVYVKEINNIPYCYFVYVPYKKEFTQNKEDLKKLIFSVIISIEDNDLRSEALKFYSMDKLDELLKILKVDGMNFISQEETVIPKIVPVTVEKEEEGTTIEVNEEETTLFDDFEETTLIEEDLDDSKEVYGRILINNNGIFTEEALIKDKTVIGRCRDSDIVISNKVISKIHAKILKEASDFYITDLNSTNGTFVNDRKLRLNEKFKLKSKDKIKLGNVCLSFER